MKRDIIIDSLHRRAKHNKKEQGFFYKDNGTYLGVSWHEYEDKVKRFSKSLLAMGIMPGEKVAILGFNSLHWVISAMGAQYIGCVSVGVYTSSSKEEISYVVDHSDAKVLVVENLKRYYEQIKPIQKDLQKLRQIVLMSDEDHEEDTLINFSEFLNKGYETTDAELKEAFDLVLPTDIATFIYTSGTTGAPKAVMLTHKSIAWTVKMAVHTWRVGSWDKLISYLPLAHVAEQLLTLYAPMESGLRCYFAESFDTLKDNIKEVEPTVFFGVPRVYEKIHEGIRAGLRQKNIVLKKAFDHFSQVTLRYYLAKHKGKSADFLTQFQYKLAKDKLFSKLRAKIGFKKTRLCISGAAPISKQTIEFFTGMDLPIYEVYGQSENCGPATLSMEKNAHIGSVGRAIPGGQIKIADDGEILIKGPHVFAGYYKNDEATKEVLKDGWLYTGDVGHLDSIGFLHITDRKKDILITAGGKNVSPQNLESLLKQLPFVQSAVVVGDRRKYLSALLSLDKERIAKKAKALGITHIDLGELITKEEIIKEINNELQVVNQKLAPVEQIKKIKLLPHEFSVEGGEFTPTMKVKRKYVNEKYKNEIESMY